MKESTELLALCAFRYALGRMSYIVGAVCDTLEGMNLSRDTLQIMLRDLNEAILRDNHVRESVPGSLHFPLGMDCDRQRWLSFRAFVQRALEAENAPSVEATDADAERERIVALLHRQAKASRARNGQETALSLACTLAIGVIRADAEPNTTPHDTSQDPGDKA